MFLRERNFSLSGAKTSFIDFPREKNEWGGVLSHPLWLSSPVFPAFWRRTLNKSADDGTVISRFARGRPLSTRRLPLIADSSSVPSGEAFNRRAARSGMISLSGEYERRSPRNWNGILVWIMYYFCFQNERFAIYRLFCRLNRAVYVIFEVHLFASPNCWTLKLLKWHKRLRDEIFRLIFTLPFLKWV